MLQNLQRQCRIIMLGFLWVLCLTLTDHHFYDTKQLSVSRWNYSLEALMVCSSSFNVSEFFTLFYLWFFFKMLMQYFLYYWYWFAVADILRQDVSTSTAHLFNCSCQVFCLCFFTKCVIYPCTASIRNIGFLIYIASSFIKLE